MNAPNFCYHCMTPLPTGANACPHCGVDVDSVQNNANQLAVGSILAGTYLVGRTLGQGGFGITYIGYDLVLDMQVAVKEYYPQHLSMRSDDGRAVGVISGDMREAFIRGRQAFVNEAKLLARFSGEPQIVYVRSFFEENGTAYLVMEYVQGDTLLTLMRQRGGRLPAKEALTVLCPLLPALKGVHEAGLIHRDISPDNIIVQPDGACKLLDFGAAREVSLWGERSNTINVKHGYAPPEQYSTRGLQGPWTDVYALCATVYRAVTGKIPPASLDRMAGEAQLDTDALTETELSAAQRAAICRGLSVDPKERQQSMDALYAELYDGMTEDALADATPVKPVFDRQHEQLAKQAREEDARRVKKQQQAERARMRQIAQEEARQKEAEQLALMEEHKRQRAEDMRVRKEIRQRKLSVARAWIRHHRAWIIPAAAALFVAVVILPALLLWIVPATRYQRAETLFEASQYVEAARLYEKLGNYMDAGQKLLEAEHQNAERLLREGQYELAEQAFLSAVPYGDSETQAREARYLRGKALLDDLQYSEAESVFLALGDYKDSVDMVREGRYRQAEALLTAGKYEAARAAFSEIAGYKNSKTRMQECAYQAADALAQQEEYQAAADAFATLGDYKDSRMQMNGCLYRLADALMQSGAYQQAAKAFGKIDTDYRDTAAKNAECVYQAAGQYERAGNYLDAAELYLSVSSYSDSQEKGSQCIYHAAGQSFSTGQYREAAELYGRIPEYADAKAIGNESLLLYAKLLEAAKEYLEAAAEYERLGTYQHANKSAKNCYFQAARGKMEQGDYIEAIELFQKGDIYTNVNDNIRICMYDYAMSHYDISDAVTVDYLTQLMTVKYKDCIQKYHTLMDWQVAIYANTSVSSTASEMRFQVADVVVFHVSLSGGVPGASVKLNYLYELPNAKQHGGVWTGMQSDGWSGTLKAFYTTPAGEKTGNLRVRVYNKDTNQQLGELTVYMG